MTGLQVLKDVSGEIDQGATRRNVKLFLSAYPEWQLKRTRYQRMGDAQARRFRRLQKRAEVECETRLLPLTSMAEFSPRYAMMADVLRLRFIKRCTIIQSCERLASQYDLDYVSDRTLCRYQEQALLAYALASPADLIIYR